MTMEMFFDGWQALARVCVVGTLGYLGLVLLLRISGKRTLSKMNAFDFVITVAFGSMLATILLSKQVSLATGLLAIALLVVLQFCNTFASMRWPAYQNVLKATPTLLFFKGDFQEAAMRCQRVTREEILAAIRQQGIASPVKVQAVVLETEGSLSVIGADTDASEILSHPQLSHETTLKS